MLTSDLREGVIRGVRFLLDERTQAAAVELHRVDGRYVQLFKAVASSCTVCEERPTPLWSISARRVIHDRVRRQLFFHGARFEIAGVPVFYFHRLRMPDHTVGRASGFLIPQFQTTSNLSTGVKIPYFITLGDHADLLLTPYVSSRTNTLEGRFRRELTFGSLIMTGALTDDDLSPVELDPNDLRGYLFAEGRFFLPRNFRLNLDLELVSDNSYLLTYDYSDADRLNSRLEVTRAGRDEYVSASVSVLEDLFDVSEDKSLDDELRRGSVIYQRRLWSDAMGGEIRLAFNAVASKTFTDPYDSSDEKRIPGKEDRLHRVGITAEWLQSRILDGGLVASARARLSADARRENNDGYPQISSSRVVPAAALELRWLHLRIVENRGTDVLEPMFQVAWTDRARQREEDSGLAEFDEGNLLALSRFPEFDRYERDWRAAVGVGWTRLALDGSEYSVTAGRLFRNERGEGFLTGSGLTGDGSDWLLSGRIERDRLTFSTRALINDGLNFSRFETQVTWNDGVTSASGRYNWTPANSDAKNPNDARGVSELIVDASRAIYRLWTVSLEGRYDRSAGRTTKAGLGLTYRNECVTVDISVSRRFSSSESINVPTSTDFNVRVTLGGFGRSGGGPERSCRVPRGGTTIGGPIV